MAGMRKQATWVCCGLLGVAVQGATVHAPADLPSDGVRFQQPLLHSTAVLSRLPEWVVSSNPSLEIGADDGANLDMEDLEQADFLGSREVLVLGGLPSRLLAIDVGTAKSRSIGRRGAGPGEYEQMRDIFVRGDTILITDYALMRLTAMHRSGRFLWSRRLEPPVVQAATRIAGVMADGTTVLFSAGVLDEGNTAKRTTSGVYSVRRAGPAHVIAQLPDLHLVQTDTRYNGQLRRRMLPLRLSSSARVVATQSLIVSTSADDFLLDMRAVDGHVTRSIRLAKPLRAVTRAMRGAAVEKELDVRLRAPRGEPLIDPKETERQVRTATYADSLPAIHSLLLASDGTIWMVEGIGPTDGGWSAFGIRPDGSLVARLTSNAPGEPLAIEADKVLVREVDSDGAAVLRMRGVLSRGRAGNKHPRIPQ